MRQQRHLAFGLSLSLYLLGVLGQNVQPQPTPGPTGVPTPEPTPSPTPSPTMAPTPGPTNAPTIAPTIGPTQGKRSASRGEDAVSTVIFQPQSAVDGFLAIWMLRTSTLPLTQGLRTTLASRGAFTERRALVSGRICRLSD